MNKIVHITVQQQICDVIISYISNINLHNQYKKPSTQIYTEHIIPTKQHNLSSEAFVTPLTTYLPFKYIINMRIKDRATVYLYSISVCMGSFVLGYQLTSYSHPASLLPIANQFKDQDTLNSIPIFLSSVLPLTAIFGVSLYRCAIKTFGYITTFQYIDYLTIFASFVGALNLSVSTQILSRILLGVVVGLNTIVIPVYLTSCLPGSMGGPAGTLNQLFITIGIFVGFLFSFWAIDSSTGDLSWRLIIGFPIIPALIRIYTTSNVFPYESVQRMIQTEDDFLLHRYIDHIWEDVTLEQFKQSKKMDEEDVLAQNVTAFDQIGESFRRRFYLVCFIIFFNQFSGSSTTFALAKTVFPAVAGPTTGDVTWCYVKLSFVQIVITYLAGQFLQKYGRRAFMLQGQRVIIVCNILLALIQWAAPQLKSLQYFIIFIHILGFSLSFGPCSFVLATEIMHDITYPSILFWILIFGFGILNDALLVTFGSASLFFLFAGVSIFGLFYIAAFLVQTQGKSRQQAYKQFREMCFPLSLKWRKFLTTRGTANHSTQHFSLIQQRGTNPSN